MTRDQYIRMTGAVRRALVHLPGGAAALRLPTLVCACAYITTLFMLLIRRNPALIRVLIVPAVCFLSVTALRAVINRQRPYDAFDAGPVGRYRPGKGRSMPSRHAASAAAIAFAVIHAYPYPVIIAFMLLLAALIAALRVLSGQHYPTDVLAALLLSGVFSLIGYCL